MTQIPLQDFPRQKQVGSICKDGHDLQSVRKCIANVIRELIYDERASSPEDLVKKCNIGVSGRTLRNLLKEDNSKRLLYSTAIEIYKCKFKTSSLSIILNNVSPVVREFLIDSCPDRSILEDEYLFSQEAKELILSNDRYLTLYFLLGCGVPMTKHQIMFRLGEEIEVCIEKMKQLDIAEENEKGEIIQGRTIVNIDAIVAKKATEYFISKYLKLDNCDERAMNYICINSDGVSPKGYSERGRMQEKLEREWEQKKNSDPSLRGNIQMFTVNAMDTLHFKEGPRGMKEFLTSRDQFRNSLVGEEGLQ